MKSLDKIKKAVFVLGILLYSVMGFAESVVATSPAPVIETPIYEKIGISSTTLFSVMTIFTFMLLAFMWSMANSTKNILKYKQDLAKKKKLDKTKVILALIGLFASSKSMAASTIDSGASLVPFPDSIFWAYVLVDVVLIMFIIYFAGIVKGSISDIIPLRSMFRWKKLNKTLTNAVPIEDEGSILLDHDYDGITELDNQLPPWWKYGFYITIVWAIGYFFYYQVFEIGNLQEAEYLAEMADGEREMAEYKAAHPEMITADNVELLTDASSLAIGKDVYDTYCFSCHMEKGLGGVGPNLTDKHWLYGSDIKGVFTTISEGKPENGMAAWKALLTADKIQAAGSYILQLDYIAPPVGKEPQGVEIE